MVVVVFAVLLGACSDKGMAPDSSDPFYGRLYEEEAAIAECMAKKGFEYIPWVDPLVLELEGPTVDQGAGPLVEFEGYGVFTVGTETRTLQPAENPNQKVLGGMDDSECEAYWEAYWGSDSKMGCVDSVFEQTHGIVQEDFLALLAEMSEYVSVGENDPRVLAARRSWSSCMAEAGFEFASRDELVGSLLDTRQEMADQGVEFGDLEWLAAEDFEIRAKARDDFCGSEDSAVLEKILEEREREFLESHPELAELR